jgi:6-phosphogluconate dehydrogenase (decarboxylating)
MQNGFIGLGKMGGRSGDHSAGVVAALRNQFGGHAMKTAPKQ